MHKTSHSPPSVHRNLFAEESISQHLQCGLQHLGYVIHGKLAFMFSSCAVFIRFLMVTRGEDILMTSGVLRPNQASLKNITTIVVLSIATCSITTLGGILVGLGIFKPHNRDILDSCLGDVLIESYNRLSKTIFNFLMVNL